MIGLTADKLVLIAVLVGFLFGPERLPLLAERIGSAARAFRSHLTSTERRMSDELGVDVRDWQKLDPRRYDPRTIIRDALAADTAAVETTDQDGAAVLVHGSGSGSDDAETEAARVAETSSGPHVSGELETRPAFRRRSDGHLELVPPPAPSEEAEREAQLLVGP